MPFRTLNFESSNPTWGFTVERTIQRNQEGIAWVSYNRQLNPAAAGQITGLAGVQQGVGLDVVPSLVSRQQKDFETGVTTSDTEPVLDMFYKFTPALTGVLTLNTDFSATEVDDRQINLSRFSLFFPEKRDFFLQDVDIFSFGGLERNGIPFFSRRIGLSEERTPVGIDVGAKLTGRVGRWNVGVLNIREEAHGDVDSSNLFVGRVAANVLRESSVGMIFTDGDPNSNIDNSLVGFDFRYQNTTLGDGKAIQGELWYQHPIPRESTARMRPTACGLRLPTTKAGAASSTISRFKRTSIQRSASSTARTSRSPKLSSATRSGPIVLGYGPSRRVSTTRTTSCCRRAGSIRSSSSWSFSRSRRMPATATACSTTASVRCSSRISRSSTAS